MFTWEYMTWVLRRTLWWTLGTLLVGGLLELIISGPTPSYRVEIPLVLAFSIASLCFSGCILALALVRLFQK